MVDRSMLNRIRMRHLRCFLAVARLGTVTAAAKELNSSQPALSRSLAELDEIIGNPMFSRTGRGLALTESGAKLNRYLETAMSQIEAGALLAKGNLPRPEVNVGMLPNVTRALAVDASVTFKAAYPDVDLVMHWGAVPEVVGRLHRQEIDVVVGRLLNLNRMEGLSFEPLFTESLIFVVDREHPLAARAGTLTLQDIVGETVVIPTAGTIIREELDKFLKARGVNEFSHQILTVSMEFLRTYITQTPAVGCAPLGAMRTELASGALVDLGLRGEELVSSVGMSFATSRRLSDEALRFVDHVRAAAQKYV